jgi:NAD(P)-dependent dehydrogenase (short-subunit alcohol dehydrogenase family)
MSLNRRQLLGLTVAAPALPLLAACADEHQLRLDSRLPLSKFGPQSTAEDVSTGLDLSGQTVLVTGCNSGLGYETMRVLALRGATVLGTGRTLEKASIACDSVDGDARPLALELSNFQSVVDCADQLNREGLVPDVMILNAGINTFGELELVNGIEKIFVVNVLGHYLLTRRLLPQIVARGSGRIVHVSSRSGYKQAPTQGIDFDNLRGEKVFDSGQAYGRSKLANALFSLALAKRLGNTNVTSNAIHPGLVQTNIARTAPVIIRTAFDWFGGAIAKSPAQGAATQVYVATHPDLTGVSGAYFEDCNPVLIDGPNHMTDMAMAEKLWQVAEEMTGEYL